MRKSITVLILASLIAAISCLFLCSCIDAPAVKFGFPRFGELESVTVQEYVNGQPVSREISYDPETWADFDPDDLSFMLWGSDAWELKQVDEDGKADTTQALRYRLTTTDGTELEFYVYIPSAEGAAYFQKADGELWRDTSDYPDESFTSQFVRYQSISFKEAFGSQIESRDFKMLPEYNGTGKALVIEDDSAVADNYPGHEHEPRIKCVDVYWDGWDGVASLQLPHYQGYWGKDDYGAIRAEDVRYVMIYETTDAEIDGHWVDSHGNHVSNSYQYKHQGTIYDLMTGESATFVEREGNSIFDQAKEFIDKANAQG